MRLRGDQDRELHQKETNTLLNRQCTASQIGGQASIDFAENWGEPATTENPQIGITTNIASNGRESSSGYIKQITPDVIRAGMRLWHCQPFGLKHHRRYIRSRPLLLRRKPIQGLGLAIVVRCNSVSESAIPAPGSKTRRVPACVRNSRMQMRGNAQGEKH